MKNLSVIAGLARASRTSVRPRRLRAGAYIWILLLSVPLTLFAAITQADAGLTTLNGVFSSDQAAKGEMLYQNKCAKCHEGDDAGGPSLFGRVFIDRWREDNLETLFNFMRDNMPADSAGSLSDSEYLSLVAHVLEANGYRASSKELTVDALAMIRLVGPDGPKPLPNNTLVQVVGCLTQTGENEWGLAKATMPARTREGTETNPEELKRSNAKPLGSQQFNLQNFARIRLDFKPDQFQDHKVQVKGVLTHQSTGSDRISLTLFDSLAPTCMQ